MNHTHILLTYRSQNSEMLFRASDGICLGQRKNAVVVFGEAPNKKDSRVFIDGEHATRWLRDEVSAQDMKLRGLEGAVLIEDRDGEGLITLPADAIDLPGSMSKFN